MPGGTGPVGRRVLPAAGTGGRDIAAVASPNEIFFHLDVRHVFFQRATGYLYFVDAPEAVIANTVHDTLLGMNVRAQFEQLHLDAHGTFNATRRVLLDSGQSAPVLIALRLAGIGVIVR